jgi:hypothetical protein
MSKGLEYQFCTGWESWDEVDTFCLQFTEARLRPEIAAIVGWDVAEVMAIDCSSNIVSFYLADGSEQEYPFTAQLVVDKA